MKTGLIYKATNKVNGKSYIGLTTQDFETRKNQHIYNALNNFSTGVFAKAIIKYGQENFE
jgi:predicted GIY-YIG superfamily endonuclease